MDEREKNNYNRSVYRKGLSTCSAISFYCAFGFSALFSLAAAYSSTAVAAMGITQKINMIPMYITMGISQGVMPLVGYNYASRNRIRRCERDGGLQVRRRMVT